VSVKSTAVAPPGETDVPKVAMPAMVKTVGSRWVRTVIESTTKKSAASADAWSIATSPARTGAWPSAIRYVLRSGSSFQLKPNAGACSWSPTVLPSWSTFWA
jgi:hypothetical protein